MSFEPLVENIVRSVLERWEKEPQALSHSAAEAAQTSQGVATAAALHDIYQQYRARYCSIPPSEEKFSWELYSSVHLEWGQPLFCIFERDRLCDSCGRCEVRGF